MTNKTTSAISALLGSSSKGGSNNPWTDEQMKLAVGMKLGGAKRKDIADQVGHPIASYQYLIGVKLKKFKTSEDLFSYLGVDSKEELIEYAHSVLQARYDAATAAEQATEETA